jgi:hypothetical protein
LDRTRRRYCVVFLQCLIIFVRIAIAIRIDDRWRTIDKAGKWHTFSGSEAIVDGVQLVSLHGHTPGHTGHEFWSKGQRILFWGDTIHVQIVQLRHPEITAVFDIDQAVAAATRNQLLPTLDCSHSRHEPAVPPAAVTGTTPATSATPATPPTPSLSFFDRYKIFFIVGLLNVTAVAAGFGLGRIGRSAYKTQNRLTPTPKRTWLRSTPTFRCSRSARWACALRLAVIAPTPGSRSSFGCLARRGSGRLRCRLWPTAPS